MSKLGYFMYFSYYDWIFWKDSLK